jgi:hypothetical protein
MSDGSQVSLFYVAEVTSGTTPTDPALSTLRITGTTLGAQKDALQSEEIRSDRQIEDFRLGSNRIEGSVSFEDSYTTFDILLVAALMSSGWATDTPSAGIDQIKAEATRQSFTIIRFHADQESGDKPYHIYRGCEIDSLNLAVAANAMVTGEFSVFGKTVEYAEDLTGLGTPTYPAATTTEPMDSFTGTIEEGGASTACITELSLSLSNGLAPFFCIGSSNMSDVSVGRSNLTGTVTAKFSNSTLLEKFANETESSIELDLLDSAGNSQKHIVPRLVYTGGQADVAGEGPITQAMPFQALRDSTADTNYVIERNPV